MAEQRRRPSAARGKGSGAARKVVQRKPRFLGWRTTDEEEIERRRLRAEAEPLEVRPIETTHHPFASFAVGSGGREPGKPDGGPKDRVDHQVEYRVEIRSLDEHLNTCSCPDHRINGLGTCKHVEAVLLRLAEEGFGGGAGDESGSPDLSRGAGGTGEAGRPAARRRRVEIFLDRAADPPRVRVLRPPGRPVKRVEDLLDPFFGTDGTLLAPPESAIPALARRLEAAPRRVRERVRLSAELPAWAEEEARRAARQSARERFEADVAAGKRSLDLLRHRLYSYQEEGALHLAFAERALLGDEMGLGKTVQAIAACELLRRLRGIERVLVVSPVSLKGEWEEQIAKFTDLPSLLVMGRRAERLRQYRERSFFYLTNYEQILSDGEDLQRLLAPDVIILDEAQRIKNWRTKTAQAVKRLESRYAFVLTGTPLENRIDDLYSIVQFLDPRVFGPLFRFNRDFHELDERGRPVGYKNLSEMHRRLRPVLLRRRKGDVEGQLPGRTVNSYYVSMHKEQQLRYEEYEMRAARLAAIAKRRHLTREEFEKLQMNLACMRMVCDTPYILDPECRICPKLEELEAVFEELLGEDGQKVLVFSEWERMLELVRELAIEMKVGFAWHTGSVPQGKRRDEIRRFKDDADCRLFLSTDSGGLGLNLQVASAVVNLDLPWNPARLEQRIARAWRKHQTRSVQVIHLVTEHSIEHRMQTLLAGKQALADDVLDGQGVDEMPMPSGRAAFMERLEEILEERLAGRAETAERPAGEAAAAPEVPAPERLRQDLSALLGERLLLLDLLPRDLLSRPAPEEGPDSSQGRPEETAKPETVLAVVDRLEGAAGEGAREAKAEDEAEGGAGIQAEIEAAVGRCFGDGPGAPRLELLDRATYETVRRLADAGVLQLAPGMDGAGGLGSEPLVRSPALAAPSNRREEQRRRRLAEARDRLAAAQRKLRMTRLLTGHDFAAEALAPLTASLSEGLLGLARLAGIDGDSALDLREPLEERFGPLTADGIKLLGLLEAMRSEGLEDTTPDGALEEWVGKGETLLQGIEETLDRAALGGKG